MLACARGDGSTFPCPHGCEAGTEDRNRRHADGIAGLKQEGIRRGVKHPPRAELRQYADPPGEATARGRRLPRKAAKLQSVGARTGNRHRWSRRVSTGARVSHGQGTRQTGPVTSGEGALVREGEAQRNGPGDCLAKTQGYAKPQGEVYGPTPARCRKVKRRSQPFEGEAPNRSPGKRRP